MASDRVVSMGPHCTADCAMSADALRSSDCISLSLGSILSIIRAREVSEDVLVVSVQSTIVNCVVRDLGSIVDLLSACYPETHWQCKEADKVYGAHLGH